jgi:hypothetical protein
MDFVVGPFSYLLSFSKILHGFVFGLGFSFKDLHGVVGWFLEWWGIIMVVVVVVVDDAL